ncbi:SseB family protein [Spirosoma fluviale]|uniref:SseB protein N-terminal domain-containing protein n=1 Tax=Spirosoma fluviale TaxID=1597977 RepID=A0A286GK33_9BACT|nr:SseB family protein [Spirosoma fluviale]SOD95852.1 SseB protein N-terminal domain-containing protein [Spirosoma fluviale]
MGLFDFLKRKKDNSTNFNEVLKEQNDTLKPITDYIGTEKSNDESLSNRNFIDDLIGSFKAKDQVIDASFGFVQFQNANQPQLFLSVGLTGDEESVKSMTWFIKSIYFPETTIQFASNLTNKDVYDYIKSDSFSFYNKDENLQLEQKLMKSWFEPRRYKNDLVEEIKKSKLIALFKNFDKESQIIDFQTYVREDKEFVPLFSDREMIRKSGMTELPPGLTIVGFDFEKINEVLKGDLENQFFVLNPGTAFEVAFYA